MYSYPLLNSENGKYVDHFKLTSRDLQIAADPPWSIQKTRLQGGRRDGVDLVTVHNGLLSFTVIPTRGMNLWKAEIADLPIGWNSPVTDGPINPAFVDLHAWGGLGWLDGFDELLARCGLDSFGPPYKDGDREFTLHGRISNIPAHYLSVHVDENPPHAITIEGRVLESRLFHTQVEMVSKITTVPGTKFITIRDEFTNKRDSPSDLQILYHWNFGPPLMEEGARFAAPCKTVVPRDKAATEGLKHYATYGPPAPASAEMVYFFELLGDGIDQNTIAMLANRARNKAVALRFSTKQLPGFTLWKNQGGAREGYVTGLEPSSNYPNPKPFEAARKRVKSLAPYETVVAEMVLEVANEHSQVEAWEAEIHALQSKVTPTIHPKPVEPFTPEA